MNQPYLPGYEPCSDRLEEPTDQDIHHFHEVTEQPGAAERLGDLFHQLQSPDRRVVWAASRQLMLRQDSLRTPRRKPRR
jgi:hypothetical protein